MYTSFDMLTADEEWGKERFSVLLPFSVDRRGAIQFSCPTLVHDHTEPLMAQPPSSFYFVIIGTKDNPLFELEFGSFRGGGDGVARVSPFFGTISGANSKFREDNKHMNQFIVHSSLDIVEEVQWTSNTMCIPIFPCGLLT